MKIFFAAVIFIALAGCQSAPPPPDAGAAPPVNPSVNDPGTHWLGYCRPVLNEAGEVTVTRNAPNSLRSDFDIISDKEIVRIDSTYEDESCKEMLTSTRASLKCDAPEDKDGFRICQTTKYEMFVEDDAGADKNNKAKTCGHKDWKRAEWVDVTNTPCAKDNAPDLTFKSTVENDQLRLQTENGQGKILSTRYHRR